MLLLILWCTIRRVVPKQPPQRWLHRVRPLTTIMGRNIWELGEFSRFQKFQSQSRGTVAIAWESAQRILIIWCYPRRLRSDKADRWRNFSCLKNTVRVVSWLSAKQVSSLTRKTSNSLHGPLNSKIVSKIVCHHWETFPPLQIHNRYSLVWIGHLNRELRTGSILSCNLKRTRDLRSRQADFLREVKWSKAKWSEVKRSEVKRSEVKWSEAKWSEVKWSEVNQTFPSSETMWL